MPSTPDVPARLAGTRAVLQGNVLVFLLHAILFVGCVREKLPVLVFALLLLAEYFVRVPMLLYGQGKVGLTVKTSRFEASAHPNGQQIWEYLRDQTLALHAEGFHLLDPALSVRDEATTICIAFFQSEAGERAEAAVVSLTAAPGQFSQSALMLQTGFTDGTRQTTAGIPLGVPVTEGVLLRHVEDPIRLVRIHRTLASATKKPTASIEESSPERLVAEGLRLHLERQVREGKYEPDSQGGFFRYTLKGALATTLLIAPIVSDIATLRADLRERRLLKQLGFEGPDEKPIRFAGQANPRMTWRLVAYIAGVSALYFFALHYGPTPQSVPMPPITAPHW